MGARDYRHRENKKQKKNTRVLSSETASLPPEAEVVKK